MVNLKYTIAGIFMDAVQYNKDNTILGQVGIDVVSIKNLMTFFYLSNTR